MKVQSNILIFILALAFSNYSTLAKIKPDNNTAHLVYRSNESNPSGIDQAIEKELNKIEQEQENTVLAYLPTDITNAIEKISNKISELPNSLNQAKKLADNPLPTLPLQDALELIEDINKVLASGALSDEEAESIKNILDQYRKDIEEKNALIIVQSEDSTDTEGTQITRRKKCRVFCSLTVRDFIEARNLEVNCNLKTRCLFVSKNVTIQGDLTVYGDIIIKGKIVGPTGAFKGQTGATGSTGATGASGSACLILPTGCCLQLVQGVVQLTYSGCSGETGCTGVGTINVLEGSGFSAMAAVVDGAPQYITICYSGAFSSAYPASIASVQTSDDSTAVATITSQSATGTSFKISFLDDTTPEWTRLNFASMSCTTSTGA